VDATTSLEDILKEAGANPPALEGKASAQPSCSALTRAAIEGVVIAITAVKTEADANLAANGPGAPGAGYAAAATQAVSHVKIALDKFSYLLKWLDDNKVFSPKGYVTYPGPAYAVYNYVREAVLYLHLTRHWSAVSAVYNADRDAHHALKCIDNSSALLEEIEVLGTKATTCYLGYAYP
jgi:hypothetical protein